MPITSCKKGRLYRAVISFNRSIFSGLVTVIGISSIKISGSAFASEKFVYTDDLKFQQKGFKVRKLVNHSSVSNDFKLAHRLSYYILQINNQKIEITIENGYAKNDNLFKSQKL